jgi:hypothetical protein
MNPVLTGIIFPIYQKGARDNYRSNTITASIFSFD